MKNWFFLVVMIVVCLSGCSTIAVKNDPTRPGVILSDKEEAIQRFNVKIAKAFVEFRCPPEESFDYQAIFNFVPTLFEKDIRTGWLVEINRLMSGYTDDPFYVVEINGQQKYGFYDENNQFYMRVYSFKGSMDYAFVKGDIFLKCEERGGGKFSLYSTGG